ncbi:MAG TPA: MarR family transcriptional regulator [Candidatus Angelobacter sp.]|nr:MarR family transcriptional regulator [Candidatus Angelobacter sp.]
MEANENGLFLEDHLCFSLYACSRAILRQYRPYLDELNLTYPQYLVLLVLWEKGQRTVKELGESLDLDSGTLTPLLKRMESNQLVERRRDPSDERVVTVRLTEDGRSLRGKATCIPKALLEKIGLNSDDMIALNETIKKLLDRVK